MAQPSKLPTAPLPRVSRGSFWQCCLQQHTPLERALRSLEVTAHFQSHKGVSGAQELSGLHPCMETKKCPYLGVQTLHRQAQALQLLVDKTHDGLRQKSKGLRTIWDPHASFSPRVTEGLPHHPADMG